MKTKGSPERTNAAATGNRRASATAATSYVPYRDPQPTASASISSGSSAAPPTKPIKLKLRVKRG
jgi:hypothetical protein